SPTNRGKARAASHRPYRPGHRPVLLGDEDRLGSRSHKRRAIAGGEWRPGLRHDGLVAGVEPDWRPRTRYRHHECVANFAHELERRRLGREDARTIRRAQTDVAADRSVL